MNVDHMQILINKFIQSILIVDILMIFNNCIVVHLPETTVNIGRAWIPVLIT